jgi:hypothetical protein
MEQSIMAQVVAARGWDFEVDRGPDWLFVRPRQLTGASKESSTLSEQVWGLLEQTLAHRLVLDMTQAGSMNAALVEQLHWLNERVHGHEGIMRVCGLSPADQAFLRKHDPEGQIATYCDCEAAVMGQDRPRLPR